MKIYKGVKGYFKKYVSIFSDFVFRIIIHGFSFYILANFQL